MALNNTTADNLATAICSALNVADAAAIAKWKLICRAFYSGSSGIADNILVTLLSNTVVTTGGPATQTGPTGNVTLSVD